MAPHLLVLIMTLTGNSTTATTVKHCYPSPALLEPNTPGSYPVVPIMSVPLTLAAPD